MGAYQKEKEIIAMWYHVSYEHLGDTKILLPRVPDNANRELEGDIPRICVSSDIIKCLYAIIGSYHLTAQQLRAQFGNRNPSIYYTRRVPYIPPKCADFRENDERWFLEPVEFYFLGYLDMKTLLEQERIIFTKKKTYSSEAPAEKFIRREC